MNNPVVMQYSAESAAKAGGGEYINEGGAYSGVITEAKYVTAKTGSQGIEFSFQSKDGLKANFLSVYYIKAPEAQGQPGKPITGGQSTLNAMMGIVGARQMTAAKKPDNSYFCPELEGKEIGLFLQKKLTTKSDGDNSYGFEIKVPFDPKDKRTMREKLDNKPAQTIDRMAANYKDIDERKQQSNNTQGQSGGFDNYGGYPEFS